MKNTPKRYSLNNQKYIRKEYCDIYSDGHNKHDGYVDLYSSERKRDKIKSKFGVAKFFYTSFFLILGIIGSMMIYAYNMLHSFNYDNLGSDKNTQITQDDDGNDLINDKMILNIMLIGSDSMSVGDHGRSDSLLIMSLDLRHKKIKITSLMRDIWLNIPGYGKDRFNAAYALGGPKLTIETIEKNFGIHIDRYAVVDFEGFSNIIDSLGGINLELSSAECAYINKYSGDPHTLRGSGMKHLTGLQALHYSRDRNSIGSDFDRTTRQRNVIKSVVSQLKTANLGQITDLISKIGPMVTTNFKTSEISRLAPKSLQYLNYPMEEFRLPTNDNVRNETISQKMVLVINDMAKAKSDLLKFIYEEDLDKSKTNSNATETGPTAGTKTTQTNTTSNTTKATGTTNTTVNNVNSTAKKTQSKKSKIG